ncbi:hypothetical protein L202_01552 [Cryptococcus amylolentus CBS 6039]|uniref:PUM-HD domain-containing protein n=2 Tax=Cryptococcus amylolentus TaxID=104669 RepID=A0A1E3I4B0_9TREE|nr:hypothetical protein L202_01552 [Cryptococcus amylolentus CBS 6039]ODN83409.1 hypothetical protein L202_01552 [Cryptococcus amylolentus CBS 6039]ODO10937.1 hypothetical protein I350_01536 [Cryptococcus amylolentus CBS 6273]
MDDSPDVLARMSALNIADTHYPTIHQPQHSQSPVPNNYPTQGGYPYYTANGAVDPSAYPAQMPPGNFAYGAPPVELMSPALQPLSFDTFSGPGGEVYANQQDRNQGQGQQGAGNGQRYRPQLNQQQNNPYFGYPDQRPFWMHPQSMYVQGGGGERKKDFYQPNHRNAQGPHRGPQNSTNPSLGQYPGQNALQSALFSHATGAGQYGLPSQYGGLAAYPPAQGYANGYVARSSRRYDDSGVVRSALLEDFRLNKLKKWELNDIFGHIVEFSGDQHGSRFIQQKLETASPDDRQKLFDEIYPNAYQLMTDVFGNYVTQKMFEHGDQLQKAALAKKMEGHVLQLSMQMYGCRVVQKALEHVLSEQRAKLVAELEPHILECVKSSNANHVVQRLINLGPPQSVPDSFIGHVEELAKHPYGCRVLQKTFENLDEDMKRTLLDEMHHSVLTLTEDQFGNYVVQSVITMGRPEDRDKVIEQLKGRIIQLACHKFASNVVEKAITHADPADKRALIDELVGLQPDGTNQVHRLLRDSYANFPLQTGLFAADPIQRSELLEIILPLLPPLRHTPVGKRLENRIAQMQADTAGGISTNASVPGSAEASVAMRKSLSASTATDSLGGVAMSRSATGSTVPTSPEHSVVTIRSPGKDL